MLIHIIKWKCFFILFSIVVFFCFSDSISEAAYRIYLKNGNIISGIDDVKEEGERITAYKQGILFRLYKTSVIKTEEYNNTKPVNESIQTEKNIPESPNIGKKGLLADQQMKENDVLREFHQLKSQNEKLYTKTIEILEERSEELGKDIEQKIKRGYAADAEERKKEKDETDRQLENLRKEKPKLLSEELLKQQNLSLLNIITDILQSKSKETEGKIHRAVRMGLPRKARMYRKEKALIDKEIETFLNMKKILEPGLKNLKEDYIKKESSGKQQKEEKQAEYYDEYENIDLLLRKEGELNSDAQLKELKKLESEGKLPEHFKPYKDFIEKQHEQQKKHIE